MEVFVAAPGGPIYNHFWNAMVMVPDDLRMRHVCSDFDEFPLDEFRDVSRLLTTPGIGTVPQAIGAKNVFYWEIRPMNFNATSAVMGDRLVHFVASVEPETRAAGLLLTPAVTFLTSLSSFAARLSGHRLWNEVALIHSGGPEYEAATREAGGTLLTGAHGRFYLFGDATAKGSKDAPSLRQ